MVPFPFQVWINTNRIFFPRTIFMFLWWLDLPEYLLEKVCCPLSPVASCRAPLLGNAKQHLSLEKTNKGLYFLHYQWREEDRTDADLVALFL